MNIDPTLLSAINALARAACDASVAYYNHGADVAATCRADRVLECAIQAVGAGRGSLTGALDYLSRTVRDYSEHPDIASQYADAATAIRAEMGDVG